MKKNSIFINVGRVEDEISIAENQIGTGRSLSSLIYFSFQLLPEDWDHFEPMMRNALHRLPLLENAPIKMLLDPV